jgi:phenylalanyl-tRNA synthetase beta chain
MNILQRLGVPFGAIVFKEGQNDLFAKSILIENRGGKVIAQLGIVAKRLQAAFDIPTEVYFADIAWGQVMKLIRKQAVSFTELPKFPAVSRDLALLVDKSVEFAQIESIAYQTERKLLREVRLFDVYEGKNLPAGKKSYAVNFILQDETKTLNDRAIDAIMQKLIQNLTKQLGAELR